MRTVFVTMMALWAGVAVFATPSTLVMIPSTDIQPQGVMHLGADSMVYAGGDAAPASFVDVGLTYGVTPRLEVGIDLVSGSDSPVWGNAKFLVVTPAQFKVPVVVGIFNVSALERANQRIAYALGSTTLSGVRLTAGAYSGNGDLLRDENGDEEHTGLLLGLDKAVGKWWYGVDYISGDNAIGSLNLGVGYAFTDRISMVVGYDRFNSEAAAGAKDAFNIQFDVNL